MTFIELAIKTPQNRGQIIAKKDLLKYLNPDVPLYRSLYLYDEKGKESIEKNNSVSDFYGKRWIDNIIVDIDKGKDSDEHVLEVAKSYIFTLEEEGLLPHKSVQPFFSGTGYHLLIPNSVFEFEASSELPYIVRKTMCNLLPGTDDMVYIRSAIYRVPHTLNKKTSLFKIPLTINELLTLKVEEIHKLANSPRLNFKYQKLIGEGELSHTKITHVPKVKELKNVVENSKVVPCIQKMLNIGPQKGCRNNTVLRIAGHFRRHGIPSEYTKVALNHWNNNQLDEYIVTSNIERTYSKGYQYSCQDELMSKHCSTKCIYFKRKDYLVDIMTADTLQDEFHSRITTDFSGRTINLSKMFGLGKDIDSTIYPGELVTIFGPTGSSKTTLAQNIALGVDFAKDKINKKWQIPTLIISLELSAWYMHRRHMQIVSGKTKEYIHKNYQEVFKKHKDELSHISIQTVSPTVDQIKEKIRELQPALVIVDYIDLVETPSYVKGEYEQIKHISHNLSNLAVNYDLIIIQISQISREYSRNEVLDLYAGKGSGAIENASRKVIGLNGQADSHLKEVNLYKNTDGELFNTTIEWRPSFRLRRVNDE